MSDFDEYIKNKYPSDYLLMKVRYPDQELSELYSDQFEVWQHRQAEIDDLKAQLNNMEQCYIEKKKGLEDQLNQTKDACGRYDRLYEEYRLLGLLVGNYRVLAQEVLPRCSRELLENIEGWEKALRGAND
ncbi:hypothetical protein BS636_13605 [Acinetobacter sp. LoGeW2-3]|uniref:hypothetical protein n=1 Tax=Acinetobacter sp. LoGeW2-3 TaxID=1808001 RepID=UPI000C05BBD3|nr:hypothetical protein [Acinetobacter sp. LoGeW2-3]ATO20635.1 hypothetical protein BS636_13605 [Acinetobacter sp. LoGeW2-3]